MNFITLILTVTLLLPGSFVLAHPGGTDSEGCHKNSKTGRRHCHKGDGVVKKTKAKKTKSKKAKKKKKKKKKSKK